MGDFIRTSGTSGIVLESYNEKYSLASAWESKEGKTMLRWAKEQRGRDEYAEKATPTKVTLGDKVTATGVLLMLLFEITGKSYGPEEAPF